MLDVYYERLRLAGLVRTKTEFCREWLCRSHSGMQKPPSAETMLRLHLTLLDRGLTHLAGESWKDLRKLMRETDDGRRL